VKEEPTTKHCFFSPKTKKNTCSFDPNNLELSVSLRFKLGRK